MSNLFIGTLFAITATLVRQIGVIIPISFALVYVFTSKPFNILYFIKASIAPVCVMLALYLFNYYVSISNKGSSSYFSIGGVFLSLEIETFERLFNRLGTSGMTLGLFLFPILLLLVPDFINNSWKKENWLSLVCTLILIIPLIHAWTMIPLGNIFYNFGLGPKLLKDTYILQQNNTPIVSEFIWDFIRTISLIGGILLYYYVFNFLFRVKKQMQINASGNTQKNQLFSLFLVILFFVTFIIPAFFFDRYLIQLMLPLIIIIFPAKFENGFKGKRVVGPYIFIFLFLLLSTCLTHDYLAWNRARWQGVNYLIKDLKIKPTEVDGGFEVNGWYQTFSAQNQDNKKWGVIDKDNYLITFGMIPGYVALKTFPYTQYIPFEERNIYLLCKIK